MSDEVDPLPDEPTLQDEKRLMRELAALRCPHCKVDRNAALAYSVSRDQFKYGSAYKMTVERLKEELSRYDQSN